ncbi:MAG: hypothetical protein ABR589_06380 [Chthoniobacterales bacterium]
MLPDIRAHLIKTPFAPFSIRTADGQFYEVPTRDHIYLPPGPARVIVSNDEGISVILPALMITGIVVPIASTNGAATD